MELMSSEINEISLALCKAQSEMGPAYKDKKNPFFKSTYADLSSCITALREPFGNNDLCFFQSTLPGENGVVKVITTIAHKSGQWIRGIIDIRPEKNNPQGAGSAISYGKRYGLQALAGLPTEDDDAEGAMNRQKTHKIQTQRNTTINNVWAEGVRDKFIIMCEDAGYKQNQQAEIVKYYLSEIGLEYMNEQASKDLIEMFTEVSQKCFPVING